MNRITILLTALLALPLSANAQWYLFPLTEEEEKTAQTTKPEEKTVSTPAQTPAAQAQEAVIEETPAAETEEEDIYTMDKADVINVSLILPMNLGGKASANFIEMYSGALLAARDLGEQGLDINLSVYDSDSEESLITEDVLKSSDVIIGPVSTDALLTNISKAPKKRFVSPLEPKAAALVDSSYVIQAPSQSNAQVDELIQWLINESVAGDDIILVKDSVQSAIGEQTAYLLSKLGTSGLRYKTTYLPSSITPSSIGNTRYVIASERDSYIATAVRQIGISSMKRKKSDLYIYGTSRVRNAKGVELQYLYRANARITMNYAVDYSDPKTREFILAYRALFKDEPASFAFQGYDVMNYFTKICAKYGRKWYKKLPEYSERGLQSNFKFVETEAKGNINTAVRKVCFNPDSSITVQ